MKVVIQVVEDASVSVNNELVNKIGKGYLLFVGIDKEDNDETIRKMAHKIKDMRIIEDCNGKTNLSINDIDGEILSISQFTLCADFTSRRPSFSKAADASTAKHLYNLFNMELSKMVNAVKDGKFGEEMIIKLTNHGPFTVYLENKDL